MERVLTLYKDNAKVRFAVKWAVITISIAAVYLAICVANPALAKSTIGIGFDKTVKFANALKALSLAHPLTALGTGVGASMFNFYSGDVQPAYLFLPWASASLGVLAYYLRKSLGDRFGKAKDLAVLAGYGALNGALVAFNKFLLFWVAKDMIWSKPVAKQLSIALASATSFKIVTSALVFMGGAIILWSFGKLLRSK